MADASTRSERADEDAPEGRPSDELDLDGLKLRGDVKGLLELAKAHRNGTAKGGRDLKRCFDAYAAAAELGSAEAEYAVALFWMSGGVVERDLKEGAMRLRAAADKGSLPARVYLGNLYELGVHYKADSEKADVWYRNAARAGNVTAEAGTLEHTRELAELGCVRFVLELVQSGTLGEEDKARLLQRARAHGYGLRKDDAEQPSPNAGPPDDAADRVTGKDEPAPEVAKPTPASPTKTKASSAASPSSGALGAFAYALLFAVTGIGAGYAAMHGARELVAHGGTLPWLGTRTDLVFPIVLAVVGVLPACLVCRISAVAKALLAGALLGGIGAVAWGTGQAVIHASRGVQGVAFALAGFLAAIFVLGLLGGTKRSARRTE